MTGKADAALKQLSLSARALNKVSDEISNNLLGIENSINSYKLGLSAWVDLEPHTEWTDDGSIELSVIRRLGYDKVGGKWALVYGSGIEETDDWTQIPLRDAPREARMEALERITDLLEALSAEAAKVTLKASKSLQLARELADGLGSKESK